MATTRNLTAKRQFMIARLRQVINVPYARRWEEFEERDGLPLRTNCYMLMNWVAWQCRLWYDTPLLDEQSQRGQAVIGIADAILGDWLFVMNNHYLASQATIRHVGALASNGHAFTVIHASATQTRVIEEPYQFFCARYRLVCLRRMVL